MRHTPPLSHRPYRTTCDISHIFYSDDRQNRICGLEANDVQGTFFHVFSDAQSVFGDKFLGACCDTGASKCVIGRHQARLYCNATDIPYNPSHSTTKFRFGNGVQKSLGTIPVRIPAPIGSVLLRHVDVVAADVPLLIGLDFLDDGGIYLDNTRNELVCRRDG